MAELKFLPDVVNVEAKAGDRVRWSIDVTDDDGDPVDWSSYSFSAKLRVNAWDTATAATISVDSSGAAAGHLVLTVSKADNETLFPPTPNTLNRTWVWDLQRTKTADATDVRTTHGGTYTLTMDVTR